MFNRESKAVKPALEKPVDTTERKNCIGQIVNKTPYLSGDYTYFAVAILVALPDGGKEVVLDYSGSGSTRPLALCKPGHQVKVSLCRSKPEDAWYVQSIEIVYDIEREKADLAKLLG